MKLRYLISAMFFKKPNHSKISQSFFLGDIYVLHKLSLLVQNLSSEVLLGGMIYYHGTQDRKTMLPNHHLLLSNILKMETYYVIKKNYNTELFKDFAWSIIKICSVLLDN